MAFSFKAPVDTGPAGTHSPCDATMNSTALMFSRMVSPETMSSNPRIQRSERQTEGRVRHATDAPNPATAKVVIEVDRAVRVFPS